MKIKIETKPVKTLKEIKNDTRFIKNEIARKLNLNREQFKLQNGLITLQGYSKEINSWINLTSTIGNFPKYLKSDLYLEYKLYCNVETK